MKRPMCRTCPYWCTLQPKFPDRETLLEVSRTPDWIDAAQKAGVEVLGDCRRHPQTPTKPKGVTEWCGEHPDFPAYIAATRPAE
jgi:hypothetical protein